VHKGLGWQGKRYDQAQGGYCCSVSNGGGSARWRWLGDDCVALARGFGTRLRPQRILGDSAAPYPHAMVLSNSQALRPFLNLDSTSRKTLLALWAPCPKADRKPEGQSGPWHDLRRTCSCLRALR